LDAGDLVSVPVHLGKPIAGNPVDGAPADREDRRVATLRAVVEMGPEGLDGAPWPIEVNSDYRWEILDGATAPNVIATVLAALAEWCRPEDVELDRLPAHSEALRWIAESDHLVIRGGIQAADAGTTVDPGCCADFENWRAWPAIWLGHDPTPWIEQTADGLLVHQDKASQDAVYLGADSLPGLLTGLRDDLIAFLRTTERWITDLTADPRLAAAVITNIDRHTVISEPLSGSFRTRPAPLERPAP
jgi:hypothetical protein